MSLGPYKYITPASEGGTGDMSGTAAIRFNVIHSLHLRRVSLHLYAPADSGSTRAQTFALYGSDDPRVKHDELNGTTTAEWCELLLPSGSVHIDTDATGWSITLPSQDLALAATVARAIVNIEHPPAFLQLRMAASGTGSSGTGATDDDLSCWASGY